MKISRNGLLIDFAKLDDFYDFSGYREVPVDPYIDPETSQVVTSILYANLTLNLSGFEAHLQGALRTIERSLGRAIIYKGQLAFSRFGGDAIYDKWGKQIGARGTEPPDLQPYDFLPLAGGIKAIAGTGLRGASQGLLELLGAGGVRNSTIIGVRQTLLKNGFTQGLARNGSGYLFRNAAGEEVRVMSRAGAWDIRIMNRYGNYLDEFGNVAAPGATHGIPVRSR